jgi:hypothetical protein
LYVTALIKASICSRTLRGQPVAPACTGSGGGSDHFGSYVRSLSLHFCMRLFPRLNPCPRGHKAAALPLLCQGSPSICSRTLVTTKLHRPVTVRGRTANILFEGITDLYCYNSQASVPEEITPKVSARCSITDRATKKLVVFLMNAQFPTPKPT